MKKLIKAGKMVNPVFKKGDLGWPRLTGCCGHISANFIKFRKYYS